LNSLVLCYSAADEPAARDLGQFIEATLPFQVSYDECVVRPDFDLIDAAERALSAWAALVLLSPDSVPKTWKREKWEPVFFAERAEFGTHLGFVLLRECRFPELFRRQRFFDLSRGFTPGARELRRWLLRPGPVADAGTPVGAHLDEVRTRIADRPALADDLNPETIDDFVRQCGADFEAVLPVDCRHRSRAGVVGDLGYAIGARLEGTTEENLAALDRHCQDHRYLFILGNLSEKDRDLAAQLGKSSVILMQNEPIPVSLDDLAAAFFVSPRDESRCVAMLGAASARVGELLGSDFESGLRLGWAVVAVLKSGGRFAETIEILDAMEQAARERGDALALYKIEWEQSWLRERDPQGAVHILPTAALENAQLELFG
jgi:hypothetical protein